MSEVPASVEPLKIPVPRKLPRHEVASFVPAPAGWFAYYLDRDRSRVMVVGIGIWAVVEYDTPEPDPSEQAVQAVEKLVEDDGDDRPWEDDMPEVAQEIRHFTSTSTGAWIDLLDLPYTLICVLGPSTKDHVAVVQQHLAISGVDVGEVEIDPNAS